MNKAIIGAAIASILAFSASASAADVRLINEDAAGVGLNDTTPAVSVGGNPGKTRGEQARIVYQYAMDMWGGVLESSSTINVYASFAPLGCTASSGTLAQAGANWTFNLTDGNGVRRRYGSALADAVTGIDLFQYFKEQGGIPAGYEDDVGDIFSQFNGRLGEPGCLTGMRWYFGLDGRTPAGQVNFLNVVMHELGHGLGVQGFLNKTSGALNGGLSDPYTYYAYDNVLNKGFESMTSAERALAMRTPGRTVWRGANVNRNAALLLDEGYRETVLQVTAPAAVARNYGFFTASFGPAATPANFSGQFVAALDEANTDGPLASDGCTAITNAADVAGKVALIERGTCGFAVKVKNAQNAGAKGVIIVNSAAGALGTMGGEDATITIPAIQVERADGLAFIANAPVTGALALGPETLAGTDVAGRTRLYSPTTVAGGSTFSHFDTVVAPNALMEPFDTPSVQAHLNVDMTAGLFADIGWQLNPGNGKVTNKVQSCDTGVRAVTDGGWVVGSNLQATNTVCATGTTTRVGYYGCMREQADNLKGLGLLTTTQHAKVLSCARMVMDRVHAR